MMMYSHTISESPFSMSGKFRSVYTVVTISKDSSCISFMSATLPFTNVDCLSFFRATSNIFSLGSSPWIDKDSEGYHACKSCEALPVPHPTSRIAAPTNRRDCRPRNASHRHILVCPKEIIKLSRSYDDDIESNIYSENHVLIVLLSKWFLLFNLFIYLFIYQEIQCYCHIQMVGTRIFLYNAEAQTK